MLTVNNIDRCVERLNDRKREREREREDSNSHQHSLYRIGEGESREMTFLRKIVENDT